MQLVMIIGATGQLGSSLMEELSNFPDKYELIGLSSKDIDIRNKDSIKENFQKYSPEIVINTAAYTDVNQAEINPVPAYEMNAFAVFNLAKECVEMQIVLMHISTDYVFGAKQLKVLTECDNVNPLNTYGASKLAGEVILRNIMDGNVPWYIVRTSNLYGKNPNKEKGTFLLNCLKKIKNKENIYLNNTNMMSPTYTNDAAWYVGKILEKEHGLYHASNFDITSPYDFITTAVTIINENNFSNDYNMSHVILKNETNSITNRPRFSFIGTSRSIGCKMPTWEDALNRFLVENKEIL
jgi:dTDP-4-dehydrorhamnose reductase